MHCIVYDENEVNIYQLADKLNRSNDTYAKQDLFDVLYRIGKLKDEGLSQREIGELFGWGKGNTSNYSVLLEKMSTRFLDLTRDCQIGRVEQKSTHVDTFDFTEGWFRTSGLYDLSEEFQLLFFEKFKADGFNWPKAKVQQTTARYKL